MATSITAPITIITNTITAPLTVSLKGDQGEQGIQGITGEGARVGKTAITGTTTCVIDVSNNAAEYTFTATEAFELSLTGRVAEEGGQIVLIGTNLGTWLSYNVAWREAGGTALVTTASGEDRLLIRWWGTSEGEVVIGVSFTDVKAS